MSDTTTPRPVTLSRQTHRKSRFGCIQCKKRRVKCDETKPICNNCSRRSTPCHFSSSGNPQPPSPSTTASHKDSVGQPKSPSLYTTSSSPRVGNGLIALPQSHTLPSIQSVVSLGFDLFDLELWHNWTTVVAFTFSEDGDDMFMQKVYKIAFENAHVAQLIIAVSALHCARIDETRRLACIARSNAHQNSAINGMVSATSNGTNKSCTELYMAACMLVLCSFGQGPQPGQYLAYSDHGEPEWLGLLNGIKSILEQKNSAIDSEGCPALQPEQNKNVRVPPDEVLPGFEKQFENLRHSIELLKAEDPSFQKYLQALDELHGCYTATFGHDGLKGVKVCAHMVFAFLFRCKEEYTQSIQSKRPMALVIFAHYMVLLNQLKMTWYLEGWVEHVMSAIRGHLHPSYEHWLEWPSQHT